MIIHVTTATVNVGKLAQMSEWSQKAAAFVKENHDTEMSVLRNVGGNNDEWHFMTTHDSLAAMEVYLAGVSSDQQFWALAREAVEQELWRSTRENLFRSAF